MRGDSRAVAPRERVIDSPSREKFAMKPTTDNR